MSARFYQTGTFAVGNRLLEPTEASAQADPDRANSLTKGHRACQGCGEALGARYALDAAVRATAGRVIAANATGCLEVFSTPFPESSWRLPWIHSLFGNAPAIATGIAAALRAQGRTATRVVAQGGDGGTVDIAHEIPYVATATVAELRDLERKVARAMEFRGPRYLHVLVPCPLGWGSDPAQTIAVARLAKETGLFPVYEAEEVRITGVSPIRRLRPVEDYLRTQRRYAHLFGDPGHPETVARLQREANRNIERFGLLAGDGEDGADGRRGDLLEILDGGGGERE